MKLYIKKIDNSKGTMTLINLFKKPRKEWHVNVQRYNVQVWMATNTTNRMTQRKGIMTTTILKVMHIHLCIYNQMTVQRILSLKSFKKNTNIVCPLLNNVNLKKQTPKHTNKRMESIFHISDFVHKT